MASGAGKRAWHNIAACAPSRTTSPLLLLIVNPIRRKASTPPVPESDARSAGGRPARMTAGLAPVGTNGTRSTLAGYARRASINGVRRSAFRARAGRRIQTGMRTDLQMLALNCSLRDRKASLTLNPKPGFAFTSAANPELLPKTEPRAVRELFVMPLIRSREVACAEWPDIRRFEHFL
jgi:hypothetical protein